MSQAHDYAIESRKRQAIRMKVEGKTLAEIRLATGASSATVGRWMREEIARVAEDRKDLVKSMQWLQGQRLDAMLAALWPRIQKGDVAAVERAVKIEERRAKLFGLDEPERVMVGSLDPGELAEEEARAIARRLGLPEAAWGGDDGVGSDGLPELATVGPDDVQLEPTQTPVETPPEVVDQQGQEVPVSQVPDNAEVVGGDFNTLPYRF